MPRSASLNLQKRRPTTPSFEGEEYRASYVVTQIRISSPLNRPPLYTLKAIEIHPLFASKIRLWHFPIPPPSFPILLQRRPICLAAARAVAKLAAVCPGFIAFNCRNICFKLSSSSSRESQRTFVGSRRQSPICTSSIGSPTSSRDRQRPWTANCPITVQFYLLSKEAKPFITPTPPSIQSRVVG